MAFDPLSSDSLSLDLTAPVAPSVGPNYADSTGSTVTPPDWAAWLQSEANANGFSNVIDFLNSDIGKTIISGAQATGHVPTFELPGILTDVGDTFTVISTMLKEIARVFPQLSQAIGDELNAPIHSILSGLENYVYHIKNALDHKTLLTWNFLDQMAPGTTFFHEMLKEGLGLDPDSWDTDAQKGITVVNRMLAFAAIIPLVGATIDVIGKIPLAGRFATPFGHIFGQLADTMGLSWAMGITIEESFKTALGESINEEIRKEKRPTRIEWPVLRQLFKQGALTGYSVDSKGEIVNVGTSGTFEQGQEVLRELLRRYGLPEHMIDWVMTIADAQIPVGDIQQLMLHEEIDKDQARELIRRNGFGDDAVDLIYSLYIDKAETGAGAVLRDTARELYRNYTLPKDDYVDILARTNYPKKEIDNDIEAIELEHKVGRTGDSVTVLKNKFLHDIINTDEAITKLHQLGLTLEAAQGLVQSWTLTPVHPRHGLSQAKILSYLVSGLLTPEQAGPMLLDTGLNADAVAFLLQHPQAHPKVTVHRLTAGFVITAYLDGAIDETNLAASFTKAGVPDTDLQKWVDVAHFRYSHRKTPTGPNKELTKAEIMEAYKYGIYDLPSTYQHLATMNYTPEDAMVLVEIAQQGPFQDTTQPIIATLDEAFAILQGLGFQLIPPTDPRVIAAEAMVSQAGWTYIEPPGFHTIYDPGSTLPPPPTPNPGGGPTVP